MLLLTQFTHAHVASLPRGGVNSTGAVPTGGLWAGGTDEEGRRWGEQLEVLLCLTVAWQARSDRRQNGVAIVQL